MFQDEISKLVAETFSNLKLFSQDNSANFSFDFGDDDGEELPEEVPGFFFHLQIQSSTFVVRILESDNLKNDYGKILQYPEDYPSLRLIEDGDTVPVKSKLQFFGCDSIEIAKAVRAHLSNKRFPILEENVYNVSDPADSWWLELGEGELTIFFKLSKTEQIHNLIKLGPLGDKQVATSRLSQFRGYFKQIFPVVDFSCDHNSFHLSSSDPANPNFLHLVDLFKKGNADHDFWVFLGQMEFNAKNPLVRQSIRVANYYMMELSVVRRFWKQIQKQLKNSAD